MESYEEIYEEEIKKVNAFGKYCRLTYDPLNNEIGLTCDPTKKHRAEFLLKTPPSEEIKEALMTEELELMLQYLQQKIPSETSARRWGVKQELRQIVEGGLRAVRGQEPAREQN
jgi:hypothetical protein